MRWKKITGTEVIEGYGLSEASPVLTFNPTNRAKPGSIGVPLPSTEVKCVDDQGGVVAIGELGELIARGPQVMPGYWRQPDETENVLRDGYWIIAEEALSRSWVLLVNRAGRFQPACRYFNALGHSSPSQISSEIAYSWPM